MAMTERFQTVPQCVNSTTIGAYIGIYIHAI